MLYILNTFTSDFNTLNSQTKDHAVRFKVGRISKSSPAAALGGRESGWTYVAVHTR